jgi:hypothetical protein
MGEKNLFTDIRDIFSGFKKGLRQLSGGGYYVDIAYQDNPNQIFDNLLNLFWIVLYLCAGASLFFGISYHYKLFVQTGQGESISIGLAILLFLIAEIVSVFIGVAFFRFLWTGRLVNSLAHFVLFCIIGVIIYIAFDFRMGISAKAYAGQTAGKQKTELAKDGVNSAKSNMKSKYDDDIKEARATIAKGKKQTWSGKITPRGEWLVAEGNKTLQKYLDLQDKEYTSKTRADSTLNNALTGAIFANEKQMNGYGGLVEWFVLIITFIIAVLEKVSYEENKKDNSVVESKAIEQENKPIEYETHDPNKKNPIGFGKNQEDRPKINGRTQMGYFGDKTNESDIETVKKK